MTLKIKTEFIELEYVNNNAQIYEKDTTEICKIIDKIGGEMPLKIIQHEQPVIVNTKIKKL